MKRESSGGERTLCRNVHDPHCLFDNPDVTDIASRISHRAVAVYDGISDNSKDGLRLVLVDWNKKITEDSDL
jgi:hypothetical protein